MATETLQLRTYIENFTLLEANQETGIPYSMEERIEIGRKQLFDFDYPFFDEDYKPIFERNFIEYYYTREIGFETMGLFKLRLRSWLRRNMSYYNQLWESTEIVFDPLENSRRTIKSLKETLTDRKDDTLKDVLDKNKTDIDSTSTTQSQMDSESVSSGTTLTNTTSSTEESSNSQIDDSGSIDTTTSGENFNRELSSDTPDSRLQMTTNADGSGVIEYASNIQENKGTDSQTSNQESDNTQTQTQSGKTDTGGQSQSQTDGTVTDDSSSQTESVAQQGQNFEGTRAETGNLQSNISDVEDYFYETSGKLGVTTYSSMMMQYRESLINIEQMVLDAMQELFLLMYTF